MRLSPLFQIGLLVRDLEGNGDHCKISSGKTLSDDRFLVVVDHIINMFTHVICIFFNQEDVGIPINRIFGCKKILKKNPKPRRLRPNALKAALLVRSNDSIGPERHRRGCRRWRLIAEKSH